MLNNKKHVLLLFSFCSGLILALGWPARGFPGLLFVGLVPLLLLEGSVSGNRGRFGRFSIFFYSYPAFFTWNALTTWWIVNSTGIGAILAIFLNSMFMSIVFQAFHYTKVKLRNDFAGYAGLIFYWISFEYLHLNWDLNWPWLNLGNGFAGFYKWVQWYEFTGAMGGTLWVLAANIGAFVFFKLTVARYPILVKWVPFMTAEETKKEKRGPVLISLFVFIAWTMAPILFSLSLYNAYNERSRPVNIVVVQPNLDPYKEQYTVAPAEVIGRIMDLATPRIDSSTDFLIAPESAIQKQMWHNNLEAFGSIRLLRMITEKYPSLGVIIGASTFYEFADGEPLPNTARKFTDVDKYYEAYNTAIFIRHGDTIQWYHKSKLTPGVEILPSFKGFKWLENFAIDLGGTVGSLGADRTRKVFFAGSVPIAPTICYESIFGEFFSEFVRNGARVMCIITNDGWWGDTPGYKQHFSFAHLRAIETRRSIARSANTGISAFIDQRGDSHETTKYWVPAAIRGTINANDKLTFYVLHGDYIARISVFCGALLMILTIVMVFINRKKI